MVFSSSIFIVIFLPVVLSLYFIGGRKNIIILIASLLFYSWGEFQYTLLLIISIIFNYFCGILIGHNRVRTGSPFILYLGIAGNIVILCYFKYASFLIGSFNPLLKILGFNWIQAPDIHLPLGISFFTFQAITYLVDTFRGYTKVQRNILNLALYISFFPQLIAGPIVRYQEIAKAIKRRIIRLSDVTEGIERFVIGFAKKLIIADTLSVPADKIFSLSPLELSAPLAFFGILCFSLQIYFDFSGYSDMAIGLGRIFGFRFPENFNYPYVAMSIREFWHRWHMTLSRFFRDYLYIPLGGNRLGSSRTCLNLFIVFLLCGLWHGANWTFVLWGFFHGMFLFLERTRFEKVIQILPDPVRHIYVLLVVLLGWVIFRSPSTHYAIFYIKTLFSFKGWDQSFVQLTSISNNYEIFIAVVGSILSVPAIQYMEMLSVKRIYQHQTSATLQKSFSQTRSICYTFIMVILFFISFGTMSAQTYKAFIYFRF
jgi:alginate O-acetyltransferase complex protein AlgI